MSSKTAKHKAVLESIGVKDPDFYKFLKEQDADLLNCDDLSDTDDEAASTKHVDEKITSHKSKKLKSSDDDDTLESEDEEEPETDNEKVVIDEAAESSRLKQKKRKAYNKSLEEELENLEDSDEEGSRAADDDDAKEPLTSSMLKNAETRIKSNDVDIDLVKTLSSYFKSLVAKSGAKTTDYDYRINTAAIYSHVLRLCLDHIPYIWQNCAKTPSALKKKRNVAGTLKFKILKPIIKEYVCDLTLFIGELQEKQVLAAALDHVVKLADFLAKFPRKSRLLLKVIIQIWQNGEDKIKHKAFACVKALVQRLPNELFTFCLKRMYLAYTKSTELKYSDNLGQHLKMDVMQRCFADLCSSNPFSTYQHAFIYIRQMAVQLRNVILHNKQEYQKEIYNKPFVNKLYLWSVVLNRLRRNDDLAQLVYPLIQVIVGCCRHAVSCKFIPFKIHCIRCLLVISRDCQIYVPVLPLIAETLSMIKVAKGKVKPAKSPKAVSTSTVKFVSKSDLNRIVKFSTSQLTENSYKQASAEQLASLMLQQLERFCCQPSFVEMTFLLTLQLKHFCKSVKSTNTRRMDDGLNGAMAEFRQILAKIEQHCRWLDGQKASAAINLTEPETTQIFQENLKQSADNAFLAFCRSYRKLEARQAKVQFANNVKESTGIDKPGKRLSEKVQPGKMMKKRRKLDRASSSKDDVIKDMDLSDFD